MIATTQNLHTAGQDVFRRSGGNIRAADAIRAGIHPRTLYQMRDSGTIETIARGLYRLSEMPPLSRPDVTTVALKVPDAVICLVSALAFHEMTTQIPHAVDIALPRGTTRPRIEHPPLRVFHVSDAPFREGIETHEVDRIPVRIYSREKTLVDCFKYRNKISHEVVFEALDIYVRSGRVDVGSLLHHAKVCRVEKIIRPYLEIALR
jgi:hypothetical protein